MPQRTVVSCCLALFGVLAAPVVQAQGFSAFVTPPRFELQVQPGERLRQVLEIQHAGGQTGRFRVYTNDWRFRPDQTVEFSDALSPGSCRPWVAVERRELSIEPGARFRYRFEITVPPGTPPGECRFALMVEGADAAQVEGTLNFPAVFLGASPYDTPSMYHLMTHVDMNVGVFYPMGGFYTVIEAIEHSLPVPGIESGVIAGQQGRIVGEVFERGHFGQLRHIHRPQMARATIKKILLPLHNLLRNLADRLLPLSLGAEGSCQIGGNLSTNAGGVQVLRYGMMRDNVLGIEAVLADGTVISAMNSLLKN